MIGAEIFDEIKQKQKQNLILCKNKLIELSSLIRFSLFLQVGDRNYFQYFLYKQLLGWFDYRLGRPRTTGGSASTATSTILTTDQLEIF